MGIKTFKEIIDNKGYRILSKDRDIFEEGRLQSFFGFSDNDYIEFIAYDINDNQLPLKIDELGNEELVKYIRINTETIRNYFLVEDGVVLEKGLLPSQYFIDVDRILKESGYNDGIFKVQFTLINRRLGYFDDSVKSKLWIKEISPSRTEIKVLPQINSASSNTDLLTRFQIFRTDGTFRDDTLPFVNDYIGRINPQLIQQFIKDTYTEKFYTKLQNEFNINIDTFSTTIYNKLVESVSYHFDNRYSTITDENYGRKRDTEPTLELSVNTIKDIIKRKLVEIIDYYLPNRVITNTEIDNELDTSIDEVETIIQSSESDTMFETNVI